MKFLSYRPVATLVAFLASTHLSTVECEICGRNELLSPCPLSCEPTCMEDCASAISRKMPKNEPTCVCLPGFVRHKGRCIRKICCPKNGSDSEYCDNEATTVPPEHCGSRAPLERILKLSQNTGTIDSKMTKKRGLIYILNSDTYPGQFYKVESLKQPRSFGSESKTASLEMNTPNKEKPKSRCHAPCIDETKSKERPECLKNSCCKKPSLCARTVSKPNVERPPKCDRTQELVFCRPCCVPTCDNDCTNSDLCARRRCVGELSCVCVLGYVLHKGQCVRKEECPEVSCEENNGPEASVECNEGYAEYDNNEDLMESEYESEC